MPSPHRADRPRPEEDRRRRGDQDEITIWHGDCCELMRALRPRSIDLAVADPPYLVSYKGRWGSGFPGIEGDSDCRWLAPAFVEIWRALKPNSFCFSFYGWPHAEIFLTIWKAIGFKPVSHVVCVKDSIGLGHFTRGQHEVAFLLAKGNPPKPLPALSDVFSWDREALLFHPNQKPTATIGRIIRSYSPDGGIVLDPFMGSGTTLVAARNEGRRAIGIEIDAHHCETARLRLAQAVFDFRPPSISPEQPSLPLERFEAACRRHLPSPHPMARRTKLDQASKR